MTNKAIVFARSNGGDDAISHQVACLQRYARAHGIHVIGHIVLPHCSANSETADEQLDLLIGRPRGGGFNMVLVTDLTRLSRRGVAHATPILTRLASRGVRILTPETQELN